MAELKDFVGVFAGCGVRACGVGQSLTDSRWRVKAVRIPSWEEASSPLVKKKSSFGERKAGTDVPT
jgi:hypothetical protein